MKPNTHLQISRRLCGQIVEQAEGRCVVALELLEEMRADDRGLVHGGFIFGAADYAAMLAVNDPNVVLVTAEIKFVRPSQVGEVLTFEARIETTLGKRRSVAVVGRRADGIAAFIGSFSCVVTSAHVLDSAA